MKGFNELLGSVIEEPVSNSRVFNHCFGSASFVHGVHGLENMYVAFMATCIQDAGFLISRHATCILQATCMLHA